VTFWISIAGCKLKMTGSSFGCHAKIAAAKAEIVVWNRVVYIFAFCGLALCSGLVTESSGPPLAFAVVGAIWATVSIAKARRRRARILAGFLDEPCLLCGSEDVTEAGAPDAYLCGHCGYDSAQAAGDEVKHLVRWIEQLSVAHRALGLATGGLLEGGAAKVVDSLLAADKLPMVDVVPGLGLISMDMIGAEEDVEEERQRAIMAAREAVQGLLVEPSAEPQAAAGDRFLLGQLALAVHVHAPGKEEQLLGTVISGTLEALKQTLRERLASA